MALLDLAADLVRRSPPWLRAEEGLKLLLGLGDAVQGVFVRSGEAVRARFPTAGADPGALALIGAERRIRRGPEEDAATYTGRLQGWLDAHRRRGNAYVLLEQLIAYWRFSLAPRMDIVAARGGRHYCPAGSDGPEDIVHDRITWTTGTGWANLWAFFYVSEELVEVVDADGNVVVDADGDPVVALVPFDGVLDDDEAETYRAIPREWRAGHIPFVTIKLLWSSARCWGYPTPAPTTWGTSGRLWGSPIPVTLIAE